MGRTTEDNEIVQEEEKKDIMYQKAGNKPDDKIQTGINYLLNATFGEITNSIKSGDELVVLDG